MYIFRGVDPEVQILATPTYYSTTRGRSHDFTLFSCQEPVVSSGHICSFEAMQVRSVLLDEVMKDPECPGDDLVVDLDIKVCGVQYIVEMYYIIIHVDCVLA